MLNYISTWISQIRQDHLKFGNELLEITFHRIFFLSAIASPVSAAHVLIFAGLQFATEPQQIWRMGIISYHSVMCVIFAAVAWLTRPAARHRLSLRFKRLVCRTSLFALLTAGITVTSIDQLVTPAVTPFLIACIVAGILFILSPLTALAVYAILFIVYCLALTLTQTNEVILISNIVNGLTACSAAAGLSWLLWKQHVSSLQQRNVIQRQQKRLQISNRKLEQLATRDELTGLANRRMLQMLVLEEQIIMNRQNMPGCLLLLDLDHFKHINDQYGHPAGDQILQQLAQLLTNSVRAADRVARWGGEEFCILLRNTSFEQGLQVAEHIRGLVEKHKFVLSHPETAGLSVNISCSLGLAALDPDATDMLNQGYRNADVALYEAKASGRNRVVSFEAQRRAMGSS